MPQAPQQGTVWQVQAMLKAMAQSAAFALEVQALKAYMGTGAPSYTVTNSDGTTQAISLADTQYADLTWIPEAFAAVQTTEQLRPLRPYPRLELISNPGRIHNSAEEHGFAGWQFVIDAVVIAEATEPESAERSALVLSYALERMVRRNDALGGLVQLIRASGPPAQGGAREARGIGLIAAALVRYDVIVLHA